MLELRVILNCNKEDIADDNFFRVHYVPAVAHTKKLMTSNIGLMDIREKTYVCDSIHQLCDSIFMVPYHLIEILTPEGRVCGIVSVVFWGEKDINRRMEYTRIIKDDDGNVIKREVLTFEKSQAKYLNSYGAYVMLHFNLNSLYRWSSYRLIPAEMPLVEFLESQYDTSEYDTYDLQEAIDVLTTIDSVGIIFTNTEICGYMMDITDKQPFELKKMFHTVSKVMPADIIQSAKNKRKPTRGTNIDYWTPGHGDVLDMEGEGTLEKRSIMQDLPEVRLWRAPEDKEERRLGLSKVTRDSPEGRKLRADILRNRRALKWDPTKTSSTQRKKKD